MKIATYSQLPKGGAKISTQAIIDRLKKDHQVKNYHPRQHQQLPLHNFRLSKDLNSLVAQRSQAKKLARQIDRVGFGVCLVTHDTHFQAPWVLRYLQTPTIFLCQEPTRAFFEQFLAINSSWPLQNRLYESVIRAFKKKIEIKNAQSANQVIANSAFGAESILRAYAVPATPVHLGVDLDVFKTSPTKKTKQNQLFIVGNAEPQKGLPFAVKVVGKITPSLRPQLLVAGPRNCNYKSLHQLAKKYQVELKTITGQTPTQMANHYQASKATLATAYLEPFGLSVIESMACSTPVVAVDEGGFRETILNHKTGLLLPRNISIFAQELEQLLSNPKRLQSLAGNGPQRAKQFTWTKTAQKINKIIHHVVSK